MLNPQSPPHSLAPTEFCAWRKRRIIGEVHDENAAGLGGVAGHGLFSTAHELAEFGESFLQISKSANRQANEANQRPKAHASRITHHVSRLTFRAGAFSPPPSPK